MISRETYIKNRNQISLLMLQYLLKKGINVGFQEVMNKFDIHFEINLITDKQGRIIKIY